MATAASDDSDNGVSEVLECSLHLGVLEKPKVLPCQHTFCRDCLDPIVSRGQIRCPMCSEICTLSPEGVDEFPNKLMVQHMLDALCKYCKKSPKQVMCPCCGEKVCVDCETQHIARLRQRESEVKQDLSTLQQTMTTINQSLVLNKSEFLTNVTKVKADINTSVAKEIEQLKRIEAELEAELTSITDTEAQRIDQCLGDLKLYEQQIEEAMHSSDGADASTEDFCKNLTSEVMSYLSTLTNTSANISCMPNGLPERSFLPDVEHKHPIGAGEVLAAPHSSPPTGAAGGLASTPPTGTDGGLASTPPTGAVGGLSLP